MKNRQIIIALVVGILALGVRVPQMGDFMTADEENWMIRSANYWHKLVRDFDPAGTFETTHPGATTNFLAGAGIIIQEQRLGFDIDTSNLRHFRNAALAPIVLASAILIGLITWTAMAVFGGVAGAVMGAFLALDPYLLGMNQVVHVDGLLALFMLLGAMSALAFRRRRSWRWLSLAGVAGGLALGTKMLPALWLFVFFAVVFIPWKGEVSSFKKLMRRGGYVLGLALLVLAVVWPAVWAKHDNLDKYVQKETEMVVTSEHVAYAHVEGEVNPMFFYARTVLGRVTLVSMLLSIIALVLAVWNSGGRRTEVFLLLFYLIGFLVLITWVAKKGDRYALPALAVFPVLAGWATAQIVSRWVRASARAKSGGRQATQPARLGRSELTPLRPSGFVGWISFLPSANCWRGWLACHRTMVGIFVMCVAALPLLTQPYALAYNNPLFPNVRMLNQQGWGEGLEKAAEWLNKHPLAERMYVASWYDSVFQNHFVGKTMSLSSRNDYRVAYVVTYRNMGGREGDSQASDVLDEFRDREPAHVVMVNGRPYAWIYETLGVGYFTKIVGEVTAGVEVGQTVVPEEDEWGAVEIAFATYSSRDNTKDVILHVRESAESSNDLRTVRVNASEIKDNEWQAFKFEPITGAKGKMFYVGITSPDSYEGNAVTVRYIDEDLEPGQMFLRRRALEPGQTMADFGKTGDIAYRIPKG